MPNQAHVTFVNIVALQALWLGEHGARVHKFLCSSFGWFYHRGKGNNIWDWWCFLRALQYHMHLDWLLLIDATDMG
jgi:hypothetical protein